MNWLFNKDWKGIPEQWKETMDPFEVTFLSMMIWICWAAGGVLTISYMVSADPTLLVGYGALFADIGLVYLLAWLDSKRDAWTRALVKRVGRLLGLSEQDMGTEK